MAKKNNLVHSLVSERYFVWAVAFTVVVVGGVLGQIALANIELETDAASTSFVAPHASKSPTQKRK